MDAKAFGKRLALRCGIFAVSLWACFGVAHAANAASLYVSPSTGTYTAGQSITVGVYVSSADQPMNAVSASMNFSSSTLQVTSIGTSGSIVNLWAVQPTYSNSAGTVSFEGVVLNPGYTGTSGKIATITFSTKVAGTGTLNFTSGSVFANDGKGTQIYSGSSGTSIAIKAPVVVPVKPAAPAAPAPSTKPSTTPAAPAAPAAPSAPATPAPTAIPTITSYPTSVHAGESITVAGLSQVGNTIEVVYDTGGGTRTIVTVATDDAGAYTATMVNGVSGFTYKIWAEAIAPDGTRSAASRIVTTTMEAPPPLEEVPVAPEAPVTPTVVVQPSTTIDVHTFQLLTWAVVMLSAFAVLALLFMIGLGIRKLWRMRRYQVVLVPRVPHHPFARAAHAFKAAIGALRKDVHAVDSVRQDPNVAGALAGELRSLRVEVDGEFAALESEIAAKSVSAPRNPPPPAV